MPKANAHAQCTYLQVTLTLQLVHAQHTYQVTCNPAMKWQKTERRLSPAPAPVTAPAHAPAHHLHFKLHWKPKEHLHN